MKQEVKIWIRGLQKGDGTEEVMETAAFGEFCTVAGKYYLKYEELSEEGDSTRTLIKITDETIEVTKRGYTESKMIFVRGMMTRVDYHTPYGTIAMAVDTQELGYKVTEQGITVEIQYDLYLDGEKMSVNEMQIRAGDF